jgi:UDP-glucose 4-epimerase
MTNRPYLLVTGGAGYIGSHTVLLLLLTESYHVVVVDNLSNASPISLDRVRQLAHESVSNPGNLYFHQADITDPSALSHVFTLYPTFHAVFHFAARKSVSESNAIPLVYYHDNVSGSVTLMQTMAKHGCFNLVFSSSAVVYGMLKRCPVTEDDVTGEVTNVYGSTKWAVERICQAACAADKRWKMIMLRYFNPAGAHPSGLIGEDPKGVPNNLTPFIVQVAVGKRKKLVIFGDDYPTVDGTCVRDYIHVMDLAHGHLAALRHLPQLNGGACKPYNLGTGRGYSVLEILRAIEAASGCSIPYEIAGRRPGDVAEMLADATRAKQELGWTAHMTLQDMCRDLWRWQNQNPDGYQ